MPKKIKKIDKFELWKEYEKIAMHFNDLLIQLRMRALAGIGASIGAIGFMLVKNDAIKDIPWSFIGVSFGFLSFVWLAIFIIDFFYYRKLLEGAVKSIVNLEEELDEINFSSNVESSVGSQGIFKGIISVIVFYVIILILLVSPCVYAMYQYFMLNIMV